MKNFQNTEPVVTIPAALAVVANSVLALLVQLGVMAGDLVPYVVAVVNGLVLLAGLLLARRQVTPTFKAEAAASAAKEQVRSRAPARTARPKKGQAE